MASVMLMAPCLPPCVMSRATSTSDALPATAEACAQAQPAVRQGLIRSAGPEEESRWQAHALQRSGDMRPSRHACSSHVSILSTQEDRVCAACLAGQGVHDAREPLLNSMAQLRACGARVRVPAHVKNISHGQARADHEDSEKLQRPAERWTSGQALDTSEEKPPAPNDVQQGDAEGDGRQAVGLFVDLLLEGLGVAVQEGLHAVRQDLDQRALAQLRKHAEAWLSTQASRCREQESYTVHSQPPQNRMAD